jgi:2-oxo-4-hydroxy-4-carboxy-5-ureidoimidazoline decarboxylase
MAEARPFSTINDIESHAVKQWGKMQHADVLEAFRGHPMIGDISSLRAKFAHTKAMASAEQSGAASASEEVLQTLHQANLDYVKKHGFIFIICATGLSVNEMLAQLQARIVNTSEDEIDNAANEQMKITLLRIRKMLTPEETTHD